MSGDQRENDLTPASIGSLARYLESPSKISRRPWNPDSPLMSETVRNRTHVRGTLLAMVDDCRPRYNIFLFLQEYSGTLVPIGSQRIEVLPSKYFSTSLLLARVYLIPQSHSPADWLLLPTIVSRLALPRLHFIPSTVYRGFYISSL